MIFTVKQSSKCYSLVNYDNPETCKGINTRIPLSTMMNTQSLSPAQIEQITPFQADVYLALMRVPKGKVTTYKILADEVGCKSSRAVGQALKRNPFVEVPCHRVVKSNLSVGGFRGKKDGDKIQQKIKILEKEGVSFLSTGKDAIVDGSCVYLF